MALDAATKAQLQSFGIDPEALSKAVLATGEQPYKFTPKAGEIKVGESTYHIYDSEGHEGLKGRVKSDVLGQATEIGIKELKKIAQLEFEGKDPAKFIEALGKKLNVPIDEKLKEKDKDILTMTENWNKEKQARESAETKYKEREALDRDISFYPDNRIKSFKDKTLRMELMDEGITVGDYEGKQAVFENGVVKKNPDLTLADPKTYFADHFKTKGWIAEAAAGQTAPKTTFDVTGANGQPKPKFDHGSTYDSLMQKHGGWTDKAQAEYTQAQLASA